jgi:hypothetical protein
MYVSHGKKMTKNNRSFRPDSISKVKRTIFRVKRKVRSMRRDDLRVARAVRSAELQLGTGAALLAKVEFALRFGGFGTASNSKVLRPKKHEQI